ncbi:MAG: hypothetical protein R3F11_28100 [Verrucomicrobiales bacterium]
MGDNRRWWAVPPAAPDPAPKPEGDPPPPEKKARRSRLRRAFRALCLLALLALVLAGIGSWLGYRYRVELLNYAAADALAPLRVSADSVELIEGGDIRVGGIAIAPAAGGEPLIKAKSADLTFTVEQIRSGRIEGIRIDGLEAALSPEALALFMKIGGTGPAAAPGADTYAAGRIEITGGTLRWRCQDGTEAVAEVAFEGAGAQVLPDGFLAVDSARLRLRDLRAGDAATAAAIDASLSASPEDRILRIKELTASGTSASLTPASLARWVETLDEAIAAVDPPAGATGAPAAEAPLYAGYTIENLSVADTPVAAADFDGVPPLSGRITASGEGLAFDADGNLTGGRIAASGTASAEGAAVERWSASAAASPGRLAIEAFDAEIPELAVTPEFLARWASISPL